MIFLASFLLFFYVAFTLIVLDKIYKGNSAYLLLYIVSFLPFYTIFQVIVFNAFENIFIVNLIKYSKDFVLLSSFLIYVIGDSKSFFKREFTISFLDKLVLGFLIIVLFYIFIPLGESTFLSKLVYAKNIFLIPIVYFFGRNTNLNFENWNSILNITIGLILLAFIISSFEKIFGIHIHSILEYSKYNLIFYDIEPQGNYGLSWTFENQNANPRFASFFSDPLEYSASLILFLVISIWHFINSKILNNKILYLLLIFVVIVSFFYAKSRASIVSAVMVLTLALYISKYYRTMIIGSLLIVSFFLYLYFFSIEETKYLIQDTLSFQNASSLGHLVEWIEGLLSIYENPFGIGLAMSGNASGVDQAIKISGENQFLIYGVQMGFLSLVLYLTIILKSIWNSLSLFLKNSNPNIKSVGFIAGLTKFGLLIPLFTANAELYLFVALFSWYLVGQAEKLYNSSFEINNNIKIEKN